MVEFAKAARAAAQMQSGAAPDVAKLQQAMNNLNTSVQKSSKLTADINNFRERIYVRGTVEHAREKHKLLEAVRHTPGVTEVKDHVHVR